MTNVVWIYGKPVKLVEFIWLPVPTREGLREIARQNRESLR